MKNIYRMQIAIVVFLLLGTTVYGQQQAQYSQFMYNTLMVNPAYAGTRGKLGAYFIHRSQWVGIEGAPRTENFGFSAGVGEMIGLGLNVINDRLGPSNLTSITAAGSVKVPLNNNIKLSVGLNLGLNVLNIDWTEGQSKSSTDVAFHNNIDNRVRPVIGAGLYLYSDHWYFGLSSPTFIQKDTYGKTGEAAIDSRIHLYAMAGYVFYVSPNVKLKPSLLMKGVKGAPLTLDIALNAQIQNKYTMGLGYRNHDAVYILLGYTFFKSLFVGYSYDLNLSKLRSYNSGSHDIMIQYTLWPKKNGAVSPRFF